MIMVRHYVQLAQQPTILVKFFFVFQFNSVSFNLSKREQDCPSDSKLVVMGTGRCGGN